MVGMTKDNILSIELMLHKVCNDFIYIFSASISKNTSKIGHNHGWLGTIRSQDVGGGKSTFPSDDLTIWGPWSEREKDQGHSKAIPRQGCAVQTPSSTTQETLLLLARAFGLPISKDWFHNNPQHTVTQGGTTAQQMVENLWCGEISLGANTKASQTSRQENYQCIRGNCDEAS